VAGRYDLANIDPNDESFVERSPLSVRAKNALYETRHLSFLECHNLTLDDLLTIRNIGIKTANEIIDYIEKFKQQYSEDTSQENLEVQASPADRAYLARMLSLPLKEFRLSARTTNVLLAARAHTLLDLVVKSPYKLASYYRCGKKTLSELGDLVNLLGFRFEMQFDKGLLAEISRYRLEDERPNLLDEIKNRYPDKYNLIIQARTIGIPQKRISHIMDIYRLYQKEGTLERVGKIKNLTRERIRQILVKGTELGLFGYSGREYPYVEKEEILRSYSVCFSITSVARMLHIPYKSLKLLMTAYRITENDLTSVRVDSQKKESIEFFRRIEAELGRYPTTTDLQNNRKWRYLATKISRLWGSFDKFREELSIPKPVHRLPEGTRRWQENRKRLGLIIRMQHLDEIKETLINKGPQCTSEIACECGIKPAKALRLLGLLLATGEVFRIGEGSNTKYAIVR
jgi:hypothetical protein